MTPIRARDIYPEFVGEDPVQSAKVVLARASNGTRPTATATRSRRSSGGGNSERSGGGSNNSGGGARRSARTVDLTSGQNAFINTLTELSGMDKYVIMAWVIAEMGYGNSSSAQQRESERYYNWLNVGIPESGRTSVAMGRTWGDPVRAARATNDFLRNRRFGPSPLIQQIIKTAGKSPQDQLASIYNSDWASSRYNGGADLVSIYNSITGSNVQIVAGSGVTVGTVGGIDAEGMQTIGTAAAFSVVLEGPTAEDTREALNLQGTKSYMNDRPLIEFIDQVCTGSMRHYMSLPDGRFYAFFPDYFGSFNHRPPYWEIDDIEITNFDIYLSDEALATHVYVVGDTMMFNSGESPLGPAFLNRLFSNGVMTIFDAFGLNWLTSTDDKSSKTFKDPNAFLQKYGVRPYYEDAPYIHAPFFELFVAFQRFMFLWARQFLTKCEFTFMPELYPGGRVSFRDHGLICYVDSVKHEFDYENGFTTSANLSAPSADANSETPLSLGMIRAESGGGR